MRKQTRRILDYLLKAENRETDPWLQDDVRQAWITVRYAARGVPNPFVISSYILYGVHPDKLQARIEARRRAQLGMLYVPADQWGDLPKDPIPSSPKKPVQSERSPGWRLKKRG